MLIGTRISLEGNRDNYLAEVGGVVLGRCVIRAELSINTNPIQTGMKLGLLSLAGVALAAAAGEPFPIPPVLNVWEDFQYVKGSECLNGGETGVWLRKGREAKKLVVYFMGGGGCFNFETCVASKKNPRGGSGTPGAA